MSNDERDFEEYLRGFDPVQPRALSPRSRRSFVPRRIGAAAIAAAVIAVVGWLGTGRKTADTATHAVPPISSLPISRADLTRLALDDPKQLDVQFDEAAPAILPCCEGPTSSLAALAKE
jgi:hypothetical protein